MDKKDVIDLTGRVYRQTLLFPKKEPLRYKIRETADNILSRVVEWEVGHRSNPGKFLNGNTVQRADLIFEVEKDLELITSYFKLAKWQNWVSYFDIIKLEEEYQKLEDYFKQQLITMPENPQKKEALPAKKDVQQNDFMDDRKKGIMDLLKKKGKIQVKEIKEIMPSISKRTIRRDFDVLLANKMVKRVGENNNTFYEAI